MRSTNSLITELGGTLDDEKPTIIIDATKEINKIYIARFDWDDCEVHAIYMGKFEHAGNALQVAHSYIKPVNAIEDINVIMTKRTKKKRKIRYKIIGNSQFISGMTWNDSQYSSWKSIFEALEILI